MWVITRSIEGDGKGGSASMSLSREFNRKQLGGVEKMRGVVGTPLCLLVVQAIV
jgi:hypothetical protein